MDCYSCVMNMWARIITITLRTQILFIIISYYGHSNKSPIRTEHITSQLQLHISSVSQHQNLCPSNQYQCTANVSSASASLLHNYTTNIWCRNPCTCTPPRIMRIIMMNKRIIRSAGTIISSRLWYLCVLPSPITLRTRPDRHSLDDSHK